jgi:polyamine oxidase
MAERPAPCASACPNPDLRQPDRRGRRIPVHIRGHYPPQYAARVEGRWQVPASIGQPEVVDAEGYDDGRPDVPGGMTAPLGRVVVIGAGIAGLTTANALTHAGVECVVVEARDRLGGRLHTVDLAGSPIDMGGSWIHHPIGNPMRAFAEQLGVPCRDGDPTAELAAFDCAEGRRLSNDEVQANLAVCYEQFPDTVARLRIELGPGASVAQAIEAFLAEAGLDPVSTRQARQGLRAVIEAEAADMSERQSLRWMWNEMEYEGEYFGDLPSGGYRTLVDAMAAGLDIRTGFEVAEVVHSDAGVTVRSADGSTETGSHAVVTVPLGVLKRGVLRFAPELPSDRISAIGRLGFGRFEKVALRFKEPFWRTAGLPHMMLFPADPDESTVWVIGQDRFDGNPTLVFLVFHSAAGHVLDSSPEQAVDWVLEMLAQATGRPCPTPVATAVSGWATDPFAGGAYTHIPPGADPADVDLLGQPIGGRLLFAGEHTQSARLAYADGAMTSGIREAKRLLQQPKVRLGRIVAAGS